MPGTNLPSSSYWCCLYTRDGSDTLTTTLRSIASQTIPPDYIVVVDDGSTDETPNILDQFRRNEFPNLWVIRTFSKTRDIRRSPVLLNLGLAESEKHPPTGFMMISGDDADFQRDYAEEIMHRMARANIVVASGDWGMSTTMGLERQPHGGGRFVRSDFMMSLGNRYPTGYGWETWLIFKAMQRGFSTRNYPDVRYRHLRPFRPKNVYGWGRAMYSLGYPSYFVLLRFFRNLASSRGQIMSARADFSMLAGYFASLLNPSGIRDMTIEDGALKRFVKRACTSRLVELLA